MTMKLIAKRFRTRPPEFPPAPAEDDAGLFDNHDDGFGADSFPTAQAANTTGPSTAIAGKAVGHGEALDKIKHEGLTGRQLRMARKLAQKHGLWQRQILMLCACCESLALTHFNAPRCLILSPLAASRSKRMGRARLPHCHRGMG